MSSQACADRSSPSLTNGARPISIETGRFSNGAGIRRTDGCKEKFHSRHCADSGFCIPVKLAADPILPTLLRQNSTRLTGKPGQHYHCQFSDELRIHSFPLVRRAALVPTGPKYKSSHSSSSFTTGAVGGAWPESSTTCRLSLAGVPSN